MQGISQKLSPTGVFHGYPSLKATIEFQLYAEARMVIMVFSAMATNVFISYSRKNEVEAEKIERHLKGVGVECYRDTQLIPGSPEWEKEIEQAISNCSVLIALLSQYSVESKFVRRELALADDGGKACIPVHLSRNVDLKLRLACNQRLYAEPTLDAILGELERSVWIAIDNDRNRVAYEAAGSVTSIATHAREIVLSRERFGLWLGETGRGSQKLQGESYVFATRREEYVGSMMVELPLMTDFVCEARIVKDEGSNTSWFGFEYGETWPGNYYQFLLNGNGTVRVSKHWKRTWGELGTCEQVHWAVRGNAANVFKVARRGDAIHLFLNDFHAFSTKDGDVKSGRLGFVAGPELTVGFSRLKLAAVEPDVCFTKCVSHWESLEIVEARSIAREILQSIPDYRHPTVGYTLTQIVDEPMPDRRTGILIVIGKGMLAQLHDGTEAQRLREVMVGRSKSPAEAVFFVTDLAMLENERFHVCAWVSIGGPETNMWTRRFTGDFPKGEIGEGGVFIQELIGQGDRRLLLWGTTRHNTAMALEYFLARGGIEQYLNLIWNHS